MTLHEYNLSDATHFEIDFNALKGLLDQDGEYIGMRLEDWHREFDGGFWIDEREHDVYGEGWDNAQSPYLMIDDFFMPLCIIYESKDN